MTADPLVRETPAWFDQAKLGIFIHWNPASVPAYAPLASLAEMYAAGPTGAGLAPWLQAERLLALGWWLQGNGEAIFGTRPWERHAGITDEGISVRYTRTDEAVYAVVLGTPAGDSVELDLRVGEGAGASLLGHGAKLPHEQSPGGTRIGLPTVPDPGAALALRLAPAAAVSALAPSPAAAS